MYEEYKLSPPKRGDFVMTDYLKAHQTYFEDASAFRVEPFRIFGDLYFVGDRKACPHLIDTGDGLILIDTGYGNEMAYLFENIRTLGFRVEDVKIIIHSHGHYDHFGATEAIRNLSGAKVYMSKADTDMLRQMPERGLTHFSCVPGASIPWPDVELEDGDHVVLGNTDITCVLSPGHTPGTLSFFFDMTQDGRTLRVGYLGGAGLMTMTKPFCGWYGLPMDLGERMLETIDKLWNQKVDIVLGNHPGQNNTLGKRQYMVENPGSNPFVNPACWQLFLGALRENCKEFIRLGY